MNSPTLTPRERAVFDFVYDELDAGAPSPTLAEIAEEFDFHRTNAWRLVFSLITKGYLDRPPRRHRALEITERGHAFREAAELEHRRRRSPPTDSPAVAQALARVRAELGRLPATDRAAVLTGLSLA